MRVTFNGFSSEVGGIAVREPASPAYEFFSPIALVTEGFLYGYGDIWFDVDPGIIQNVVWTDCACAGACE